MSDLNGGIAGLAPEELTPAFAIRLCHFSVLARCPICGGDFPTAPGFQVAVDATNGTPHKGGFLCPTCAEREAPFLTEACAVALKAFGRHAQEKAEQKRLEAARAAYTLPPPPPPAPPVRMALQKLEKAIFERDGRIKELEAELAKSKKRWL